MLSIADVFSELIILPFIALNDCIKRCSERTDILDGFIISGRESDYALLKHYICSVILEHVIA